MTVAYFDCFSGISGNMVLGAFIDSGLDIKEMEEALSSLPVKGYEIEVRKVKKHGITATHLDVKITEKQPHRHLHHIEQIINASGLPTEVKELSLKIFNRLAQAEAKIHGTTIEKVHFHEVGAVDAIVDIVGAAWGIYKLGIKEVYGSPLHVGKGMVKCAHGLMPIPAPATAELLKEAVTYSGDIKGELVTPTGAAIITTLTQEFGQQPPMKVKQVSYGAGTWDLDIPNVLRLTLGENVAKEKSHKALVLETNIDDMNPEFYDYLVQKLFANGAVDVFYTPIHMKKNRPAILLTVVCEQEDPQPLIETLFTETTTLGLRTYWVDRVKLNKEYQHVETPWGQVKVKIASKNNKVFNIKPEYEDCKAIAAKTGLPLKEVWQQVILLFKQRNS